LDNPAAHARRQAFAAASPVTEAMIHALVHAFYAKVRTDPALGPVFNRARPQTPWRRLMVPASAKRGDAERPTSGTHSHCSFDRRPTDVSLAHGAIQHGL